MNQAELQERGIKALRAFNNAIVTSRLYPPTARQVTNAVEIGHKGIHDFLKQCGKLDFSLWKGKPLLNNFPVTRETLSSFSNLIVYRQMEVLGVGRLVIDSSMDMFAFGQILLVFNAKADKITIEGGGIEYITALGLSSYFPEQDELAISVTNATSGDQDKFKKSPTVAPELLACLFGKDKRTGVREKLRENFGDVDWTIEILAVAIGYILRELHKSKMLSRSNDFPQLLENSAKLIEDKDLDHVATGLAKYLVDSLKEPALCVLLSQNYPDGFGRKLYDATVTLISTERLGKIIILFREQIGKIKKQEGLDSPRGQFVRSALVLLMAAEKSKQAFGSEKARIFIRESEEKRKKQRIKSGIKGIMQGKTEYLQNEELLEHLPGAVRQMVQATDSGYLDSFFQQLLKEFKTGETGEESQLLMTLTSITENLVSDNQFHYVDLLFNPLLEWVRATEKCDEPFERVVSLLQNVMQHYWQIGKLHHGDAILTIFHQIRTGKLQKSSSIRAIVGQEQDRGIKRSILPILLRESLLDPQNDELSYRLILQGPVALRFLVESLITAQKSEDRYKILDLLTYNDQFVPEIVLERLHEYMPWHGKRNLIKLLAETGGEEDAEAVLSYLSYEDFRVQREAFLCIYKIGGSNRKILLLKALLNSSELIKIQIVGALVRFCDPEVAGQLVELLADHGNFSEENRESLLCQLFDTLGRCSCPVSLKAVRSFVTSRGQRGFKEVSEQVWLKAEEALNLLEKDQQDIKKHHIQASLLRKKAIRQATKRGKTPPTQRIITGLAEEQAIRTLLGKGEEDKARKLLVQLIEETAQTRNFVQVEKLREWLIDINETALGDIIHAAEIISANKAKTIDKTHLEIWNELYELMSTEEFGALYNSFQNKQYEDEELVVHQGSLQTALYFINSGKVKLFFNDKGDRVLVKTMGAGEIVGSDPFFDASVWTVSVASVGITDVSVLRLEKLYQYNNELPALSSKLRDYCDRFETVEEIIKQSRVNRRNYERHQVSGLITTLLLDNSGHNTGVSSEAELLDISQGGVSFLFRIAEKEHCRLILGRKIKTILPAGRKDGQYIEVIGDILSVKNNSGKGEVFSIHVRFETIIDSSKLQEILLATQAAQNNTLS